MKKQLAELIKEAKEKHIYSDEIAQYLIDRGVVIQKHGVWIGRQLDNFRKYQVTCSECGWECIENYDSYNEPSDFDYCPNCGAEMMEVDIG